VVWTPFLTQGIQEVLLYSIEGGLTMRTKIVCILIVMGMLVIGSNSAVNAQVKYPNKPIQLVVGYGAGGAQDIFWRAIKEDLEKALKVPISIVNKAGAAGALAADFVANSKNDGYTVLGVSHSTKTVIPAIDPKAVSDHHVIALVFRTPLALVTKAESNFKSLKDVISYGMEKPGTLTCATQGVQAEAYFDLEFIAQGGGIKITHVPNPNPTDAIANVLGGHVDLYLGTLTSTLALYKGGKLRVLGITADRRLPDNPDVPTFAEQGFPQANLDLHAGLWGPRDMPQEVFNAWQGALKVVLGNPEMQANLRKQVMYVDLWLDRDKINKYIQDQYERVSQIAIREGIRLK
jgi:tripartite-type tricarboxylate transporter receptor subunit TctC